MTDMTQAESLALICVRPRSDCGQLIKAGEYFALKNNMEAEVLSVFREKDKSGEDTPQILEALHEAARLSDAGLSVYFNDNPEILTAVVAVRKKASVIITGFPNGMGKSFITGLRELLPGITIVMIDDELNEFRLIPADKRRESAGVKI